MVKTLSFGIYFYWYLFKITPVYLKIKKLESQGKKEAHIDEIRKISCKWGKALLKKAKVTLNISGTEKIPEGAALFVSNHQSYFDIPIFFAALDKQVGFVAKSDLDRIPIFNKWIAIIKSVFIDRGDTRQSLMAIQEGIRLLKNGYSLVIFPEGTRSKCDKIADFKKGSLRLAVKSGVPVVPVTINGSYKLFERSNRILPGKVDFIIHDPIETQNLSKEETNNLNDTVRTIINSKLDELLLQNRG